MTELPPPFPTDPEGEPRAVYQHRAVGLEGLEHTRVCSLYCGECHGDERGLLGTVYRVGDSWVLEKLGIVNWLLSDAETMSGVPTWYWILGTMQAGDNVLMTCRQCRRGRTVSWSQILKRVSHTPPRKLHILESGLLTL